MQHSNTNTYNCDHLNVIMKTVLSNSLNFVMCCHVSAMIITSMQNKLDNDKATTAIILCIRYNVYIVCAKCCTFKFLRLLACMLYVFLLRYVSLEAMCKLNNYDTIEFTATTTYNRS